MQIILQGVQLSGVSPTVFMAGFLNNDTLSSMYISNFLLNFVVVTQRTGDHFRKSQMNVIILSIFGIGFQSLLTLTNISVMAGMAIERGTHMVYRVPRAHRQGNNPLWTMSNNTSIRNHFHKYLKLYIYIYNVFTFQT